MYSKILEHLTPERAEELKSELLAQDSRWDTHLHPDFMSETGLKEGKTIHLTPIPMTSNNPVRWGSDLRLLFPKSYSIVSNLVQDGRLGRIYWHRLLPGDSIAEHTDSNLHWVKNGKLRNRYQIYLDIPDGAVLMLDGKIQQNSQYANCVLDFDLRLPHSYYNGSNTPWYFMVFDILN